jgi:NAD(P)H-dependent FMN reductase
MAKHYQGLLKSQNIATQLIDLSLLPKDYMFSALYENTGKNETFNAFQTLIDQHEKFVFIVPEYNGSFPGALKGFMDGLRYPDTFQNKKTALVGFSSGNQGGVLALSHLADILSYLGAEVLSLRVRMPNIQQHFKPGQHQLASQYEALLNLQIEKLNLF